MQSVFLNNHNFIVVSTRDAWARATLNLFTDRSKIMVCKLFNFFGIFLYERTSGKVPALMCYEPDS